MKRISNFKELKEFVNSLSDEQLNTQVTFLDNQDEFYGVRLIGYIEDEDDVLDKGHPYLQIDNNLSK